MSNLIFVGKEPQKELGLIVVEYKNFLNQNFFKRVFDENNHFYSFKNKQLTSVTQTLEWYKKSIKKIPNKILRNSSKKGDEVHKMIENIILKTISSIDFVNFTKDTFAKELLKNFNTFSGQDQEIDNYCFRAISFIENLIKNDFLPFCVELPVLDYGVGIAGSIDAIFYKFENNKLTLLVVDWKTGDIRHEHHAQVAIYSSLLEKTFIFFKKKGWIDPSIKLSFKAKPISLKREEVR